MTNPPPMTPEQWLEHFAATEAAAELMLLTALAVIFAHFPETEIIDAPQAATLG